MQKKEIVDITLVISLTLLSILSGVLIGFILWSDFEGHNPFESKVYYELPDGGYIYETDYEGVRGKAIRLNTNEYNGELEYQITLNPITVDK